MATNINFPIYGFINNVLALSEENWRRFFKPFITDSVQNGLAASAGANMTVYVSAGECRCGAVMGILDEMIAIDIANSDSTYDRIDSIVVQYTYGEPSTLAITIVQGTPSANPVPPTLTKVYDTLWQMEIAQILIPSGATSSSEFTITDKRVIYESIVTIDNNTVSEESVWSSQKTHEEIVSLSTEMYDNLNTKADAITKTTSGDIVTITNGADNIPVNDLKIAIEPVQDLHGESSPYPAGGGVNLFNVDGLTHETLPSQGGTAALWANMFTTSGTYAVNAYGTDTSDAFLYARVKDTDDSFGDAIYIVASTTKTPQIITITSGQTLYVFDGVQGHSQATAKEKFTKWKLQVAFSSTQPDAYHPYSNICPISGWTQANVTRTGKNLLKLTAESITQPSWYTWGWIGTSLNDNYGITQTRGYSDSGTGGFTTYLKGGETYTISWIYDDANSCRIGIYSWDGSAMTTVASNSTVTKANGKFFISFTVPENSVEMGFRPVYNGSSSGVAYDLNYFQIELGEKNTDFVVPSVQSVTIPLGQTVYGGTLDVGAGTLRVTHAMVDMGSLTWSLTQDTDALQEFRTSGIASLIKPVGVSKIPNAFCSIYEVNTRDYQANHGNTIGVTTAGNVVVVLPPHIYNDASAFTTAVTGQTLVYELATPIVITGLTPAILRTLLGYNAIWADCGAVDVNYRADTKLFIENAVAEANLTTRKMIADTANGNLAPKSLDSGDLIIVGDELRKCTANIGSGNAITNTNSTIATLADVIKALQ